MNVGHAQGGWIVLIADRAPEEAVVLAPLQALVVFPISSEIVFANGAVKTEFARRFEWLAICASEADDLGC